MSVTGPRRAKPASPVRAAVEPARGRAQRAIVVFGCAVYKGGVPSPGLVRRLEAALELAKDDPQAKVFVSGGAVRSEVTEAEAMRRWLVEHGIDEGRIVMEDRARYTLQNAEHVAPMLARAKVSQVTLVTERFHMPRSEYLLRRALDAAGLRETSLSLAPAADELEGLARWSRSVREARAHARDTLSQLGYRLRDLF
jgi:uncharacterized SAM-binding protein YcdF (DUF218 family)